IAETGVADSLGEHHRAAESDQPGGESEPGDTEGQRAGAGAQDRPGTGRGVGLAHRRPRRSSHRSAGVASMTAVKLTRSLAAVSKITAASATTFAAIGIRAAATVPMPAPRALAPQSPSIARSP